jgi:hypothetical protein
LGVFIVGEKIEKTNEEEVVRQATAVRFSIKNHPKTIEKHQRIGGAERYSYIIPAAYFWSTTLF